MAEGAIGAVADQAQNALLQKVLELLLQHLSGGNAFNIPNSAFNSGFSYAHNVGAYQREQKRQAIVNPISESVTSAFSDKVYSGTLRLLGYTQNEINTFKEKDGSKIAKGILGLGLSAYTGTEASMFGNAAYNRLMWGNRTANPQEFRESFVNAGKGIIEGISDGTLQGYTVPEALRVASMFTRQGHYDQTPNDQRASKIKRDLQDYAQGINNLRDAFQGPLDQVLTAFEKLSGSSATVMQKDRFTALTRSLYNATAFGGVTPQLLQQAIATQHAYLQGTGATQATSMALGTMNANILSQGVYVEGATQDSMNEALTRQGARWMTTGRAKELTAAFNWWADTKGLVKNNETFNRFRRDALRGNIDATSVRNYLQQEGVGGEYINSARNRRNMASPYIYNALAGDEVTKYQNAFNQLSRNNRGLLRNEDLFLSDDELFEKVNKRLTGTSLSARDRIQRASQIVEQRRDVIRNVMDVTDADTGLNTLRNIKQTISQQNQNRISNVFMNKLAGNNYSINGFSGVINTLMKNEGVTSDDIAGVLRGFLGVDISAKDIAAKYTAGAGLTDAELKAVIHNADNSLGDEEIDARLRFAKQHLHKLSDTERNTLFNTSEDQRKLKDGSDWGSLRKKLLSSRVALATKQLSPKERQTLNATYKQNLNEAVTSGFISEKEAFLMGYAADNGVDFAANPAALQTIENVYTDSTRLQKKLNMPEADATKLATTAAAIKSGTLTEKKRKDLEAEAQNMLKNTAEYQKYAAADKADKSAKSKTAELWLKGQMDSLLKSSGTNPIESILNEMLTYIKQMAGLQ